MKAALAKDSTQLTIEHIEIEEKQAKIKVLTAELEKRFKAVALGIERNKFAAINNKSYSYVSEILNTNTPEELSDDPDKRRKQFPQSFVAASIIENPEKFMEEIINFLCDLLSYEYPKKKSALTAKEELEYIKEIIKDKKLQPIFPEVICR